MPKFTVAMRRTITSIWECVVEASDQDAAESWVEWNLVHDSDNLADDHLSRPDNTVAVDDDMMSIEPTGDSEHPHYVVGDDEEEAA